MRRFLHALLAVALFIAPTAALALYPYPSRMGAGSAASVSYRASYSVDQTGAPLGTLTFTAADIGTADTGRTVIVGLVVYYNAAAAHVAPTATIGGVAASAQVSILDSSTFYVTVLYSANVPTGATANIVFTADSGTINAGSISVYALGGVPTAAGTTVSDGTNAYSLNSNISVGNVFVGFCATAYFTAPTNAWVGATENVDGTSFNVSYSAAHYLATATESPRTISCTASGGSVLTDVGGVGAVWAP